MKKFITLEGCEGIGKSTQTRLLAERLISEGKNIYVTREPGGTPVADKIREIILNKDIGKMSAVCEAHLFAASRAEHIDKIILPKLAEGNIVICDRYIDSSLAYQGIARNLGVDTVLDINAYAVKHCMPQFTVFIDLPPSSSWRKLSGKKIDDRMENESEAFHEAVYEGFKALAKRFPERIISVVPSFEKPLTAAAIYNALLERGAFK